MNGTIEYINTNLRYSDHRVSYTSCYTGIGFNFSITPSFQIRINPNVGTSIIKLENTTYNKLRIGSDLSIGYQINNNFEIEPIIGVCYFIYDKPFNNDLLDAIKTGIRIGYIF